MAKPLSLPGGRHIVRAHVWCVTACLVAGVTGVVHVTAAAAAYPVITARAAVVMDAATGSLLYAHNPDLPLPPASTTKIVTALLLTRIPPTTRIPVSRAAAFTPGLALGLQPTLKYPARVLLYAMLLKSANDAAEAVGEALGPGIPAFSAKMNAVAATAGASHSHFVNPDGLDEPGHLASARDLALIARMAMQNPTFARAVGTQQCKVTLPGGNVQTLVNSDTLLGTVPGMEGIKTGYTANAGYCFVGEANVHGRQIITVVLHSANWQQDTKALLHFVARERTRDKPSQNQSVKPRNLHSPAGTSSMQGNARPPGPGPRGFADKSADVHKPGVQPTNGQTTPHNSGAPQTTFTASSTSTPSAPKQQGSAASGTPSGAGYNSSSPDASSVRPASHGGSGASPVAPSGTSPTAPAPIASQSAKQPAGTRPGSSVDTPAHEGTDPEQETRTTSRSGTSLPPTGAAARTSSQNSIGHAETAHHPPAWLWWMLLIVLLVALLTNARRLRMQLATLWPRIKTWKLRWSYKMKTKGFPWNRPQAAPAAAPEIPTDRPARKAKRAVPGVPELIYDAEAPTRCSSVDWLGKLAAAPPRLLESSVLRHARAVLECAQPSNAAAVVPLLQAPTVKIRVSAASILLPYAPRKSEEVLLAAMQDEKSGADLRAECASTLARHTGDRYEKTWVQLLLGDGFLPAATALASRPWLEESTTRALKHVLDQERPLQNDSEVVLRTNTRNAAIAGVLALHGHLDNDALDAKIAELPARQKENIVSALFFDNDRPMALQHTVNAILHHKSASALQAIMHADPRQVNDLLDVADTNADAAEKTRIMIVKWLLYKEGNNERIQKLASAGNDLAVAAAAIAQHAHWQPETQDANVLAAAARIVSLRLGYGDYTAEDISRAFRRTSAEDEIATVDLPAGLQELSQAYQHPEVYAAVQSALRSDDGIEQLVTALAKQHESPLAMREASFWADKLGREHRAALISELAQVPGNEQRAAIESRALDPDIHIRATAHRAMRSMVEREETETGSSERDLAATEPETVDVEVPSTEAGALIDEAA